MVSTTDSWADVRAVRAARPSVGPWACASFFPPPTQVTPLVDYSSPSSSRSPSVESPRGRSPSRFVSPPPDIDHGVDLEMDQGVDLAPEEMDQGSEPPHSLACRTPSPQPQRPRPSSPLGNATRLGRNAGRAPSHILVSFVTNPALMCCRPSILTPSLLIKAVTAASRTRWPATAALTQRASASLALRWAVLSSLAFARLRLLPLPHWLPLPFAPSLR